VWGEVAIAPSYDPAPEEWMHSFSATDELWRRRIGAMAILDLGFKIADCGLWESIGHRAWGIGK
jgi:hypothetical protein